MSQSIPTHAQYSGVFPSIASGFQLWTADKLPDIDALLKQIPARKHNYQATRAHIRAAYVDEWTVYSAHCGLTIARVLATIQAQIRIDHVNGIEPVFACAGVWRERLLNEIAALPEQTMQYGFAIGFGDAERDQSRALVYALFATFAAESANDDAPNLDTSITSSDNAPVAFNHATKIRSLEQYGKSPFHREPLRPEMVFLRLHSPDCVFSTANRGKGVLCPMVHTAITANLAFCSPPIVSQRQAVLNEPSMKRQTIMSQSIPTHAQNPRVHSISLDISNTSSDNAPNTFNNVCSREKLPHNGKPAAKVCESTHKCGVFCACNPLVLPLPMVGMGQDGRLPTGYVVPASHTCPLSAAPSREKHGAALLDHNVKATIMSTSISTHAQTTGISSPLSPSCTPRARMASQHTRRTGVMTVQVIRHFPTLEQASRYIYHRRKQPIGYRFAIEQSAPERWTVCRIVRRVNG